MALRDMLNIVSGVTVNRRVVTPDGQGGSTTTTTITTLTRASIWQPGSNNTLISDKIARYSSHVLAIETDEYTFTDNDADIGYGGHTYKITGHPDEVVNRGELTIVGLEYIS